MVLRRTRRRRGRPQLARGAAPSPHPALSPAGRALQVAYNPAILQMFCMLGLEADFTIHDASMYCARGEQLSFWEVMERVQVRVWGLGLWAEGPPGCCRLL
jgi:hypothetical protein